MIEIEAGSTTIRWKLSRCMPSASARIALIGSPCETAAQTASGAVLSADPGVPAADRADRPGRHLRHRLAAGEPDRRRLVLHRRPRACPCSARAATCRSTRRSRTRPGPARPPPDSRRRRAATRACAVCRQRRSGEVTTAASGTAGDPAADLGDLLGPDRRRARRRRTAQPGRRRCSPTYVRGGSAGRWSSRRG